MRRFGAIGRTLAGLVAIGLLSSLALPAAADDAALPTAASGSGAAQTALPPGQAQFQGQAAPDDVHHMADWVVDAHDNGALPFVIIDKPAAKVFVFDGKGKLIGSAWALVGLTPGDGSAPGVGTMPLSAITPALRTTPAGRFVSVLGHDLGKGEVLWVDYRDAIALHPVIDVPNERRPERILSNNPAEHRISYGCINVPAKFFKDVVEPAFKETKGVVYILPEIKSMAETFPAYYEVGAKARIAMDGATSTTATIYPVSVEKHDVTDVVH